jgi:hypothetical protein
VTASGAGTADVPVSVAANESTAPRTGGVTIAGRTVAILQGGLAAPPPPPTDPCTYAVAPVSFAFDGPASSGTIRVTPSSAGCAWTAASEAGWLRVTAGASGVGPGEVRFTVDANQAPSARAATMVVAGQPVAVTQQGTPPAACTHAVSPATLTVAPDGGKYSVDFQTGAGCAWTASTQVLWINLDRGHDAGTGPQTVHFTVDPNPEPRDRTGSLVIGERVVWVTQPRGTSVTVSGKAARVTGSCPSIAFKVRGDDVSTDASTTFVGLSCGEVRNGTDVTVEGARESKGSIRAWSIRP